MNVVAKAVGSGALYVGRRDACSPLKDTVRACGWCGKDRTIQGCLDFRVNGMREITYAVVCGECLDEAQLFCEVSR